MFYVLLFCARNNALRFCEVLKREGIEAILINAPKETGIGCGLSVRVDDLVNARRVLSYGHYPSFKGILRVEEQNGALSYTKIN